MKNQLTILTFFILANVCINRTYAQQAITDNFNGAMGVCEWTDDNLSPSSTAEYTPLPTNGLGLLDVSAWQGAISKNQLQAIKDYGYKGLIVRAGHVGSSYGGLAYNIDPYHDNTVRFARELGLLVGHYWYAYQVLSASAEAEAFTHASINEGEPLFLDAEETDLTAQWITEFSNYLITNYNRKPVYYDYTSNIQSKTFLDNLIPDMWGAIWQAHYTGIPGNFTKVRNINTLMHQFTSDGSVPGFSGRIDLNVFFGNEDYWKQIGGKLTTTPTTTINLIGAINAVSYPASQGAYTFVSGQEKNIVFTIKNISTSTVTRSFKLYLTGETNSLTVWSKENLTLAPLQSKTFSRLTDNSLGSMVTATPGNYQLTLKGGSGSLSSISISSSTVACETSGCNPQNIKIIKSTAINEINASAPVVVSPNPTHGMIYVENAGGQEISVYDLLGKPLLRTYESSVDLSSCANGIYLLQTGNGKPVKVVKQ